ncbi:MAG: TRAP-type mannitol/chloroaromatic compound transport system substrate-binding protein [Verrucomicrobiales bacterium]|jgi:TRAP-type mannitol/chloroaromatic compound transport system substrate-binding protein
MCHFLNPLFRPCSLGSIAIVAMAGCLSSCGGKSGGGASAESSRKVSLKLVSSYNKDLPIIGDSVVRFAGQAEKASGGSLQVRIFDPGELVPAMEVLDAVSAGKVEAGYAAAGFWMGKLPASPLFSAVPFGPELGEYLAWFYQGNGMQLYQEMYDDAGLNVKVFILTILPPETSGWFKKKIEIPADLQGLKMRFFGLGGDVMEKLGVSVEAMPGGEIFPALEKGVLDATEFSMPVIDANLQFHKLADYNYFPGWHQQTTALELLINGDTWKELSASQQAIIELACRDCVLQSIASGEASQSSVIKHNAAKLGVHNETWPPELLATFKGAWEEVVTEQCASDPFFKRVWDDLSAFRADYREWKKLGYLDEE